jgi:hypothetical protein
MATTDCAPQSADAVTGKEVWSVAPMTTDGLLLTPAAGWPGKSRRGRAWLGVRARWRFRRKYRKRIWKTYTVPAPNEPGGDS